MHQLLADTIYAICGQIGGRGSKQQLSHKDVGGTAVKKLRQEYLEFYNMLKNDAVSEEPSFK